MSAQCAFDDGGPGSAIAAPVEWVAWPSNARLMMAPLNYSTGRNDIPLKGKFIVHAEAWSDRHDLGDGAGVLLGATPPVDVHFDFSLCAAQLRVNISRSGPGEADTTAARVSRSRAQAADETDTGACSPCKRSGVRARLALDAALNAAAAAESGRAAAKGEARSAGAQSLVP